MISVPAILGAALLSLLVAQDAEAGQARLSEDGTTLFLQDEIRGQGTTRPRPGVAVNLEPESGSRQIWISGEGLPTLPTVDVLCDTRRRTIPLARSDTARELHVGLYEVPPDLAHAMLNSIDCRLLLTGAPIPVPRELLWSVWGDAGKGKPAPPIIEGQVTWVIDGDTIRVKIGEQTETVRYLGINAPEVSNPPRPWERAGRDARDVNTLLVGRKTVRLELDVQERDAYGRLLAYVHVGDMMVNAEMVRRGYANTLTVPPNVKHEALLVRLQREAREGKQGLWSVGAAEAPSAAPAAPQPSPPPKRAASAFGCPPSHPIKGNLTTRGECLYFLPDRATTGKKAEFCFMSEEEARQGGCSPAR
jgi:micrococcal nuclease